MTNTLTEYNICKSNIYSIDEEIVIDILTTYIVHKFYHNKNVNINEENYQSYFSNSAPRSTYYNVIEYNKTKTRYLTNYSKVVKNIKVDDKLLIKDYYFNKNSPLQYTDTKEHLILKKIDILHINFTLLKYHFKILRRFNAEYFGLIISQIIRKKLNLNFNLKYYDHIKKSFKSTVIKMKDKSTLFIGINLKKKYSKDKKRLLNIEADLNFNTKLGCMFINNILAINYKVLPIQTYELLKLGNSNAYIIYKKLIQPYYSDIKNPLKFKDIKEFIDIKRKDNQIYIFNNYMKKIQDLKLIEKLEYNLIFGKSCFKFDRLTKNFE